MLRLTFLGTSAAQPTIGRNLSGLAVRRDRELFLVDCGEGTQRQMIRYGTGFDVDAIFFCNDDLAQGGLLGALRIGLKVPQEVAVAGFNDLTGSDQMLPALTTVRTPRTEIGTRAAQMLLALMRKEPVDEPGVDLGYELVIREST